MWTADCRGVGGCVHSRILQSMAIKVHITVRKHVYKTDNNNCIQITTNFAMAIRCQQLCNSGKHANTATLTHTRPPMHYHTHTASRAQTLFDLAWKSRLILAASLIRTSVRPCCWRLVAGNHALRIEWPETTPAHTHIHPQLSLNGYGGTHAASVLVCMCNALAKVNFLQSVTRPNMKIN